MTRSADKTREWMMLLTLLSSLALGCATVTSATVTSATVTSATVTSATVTSAGATSVADVAEQPVADASPVRSTAHAMGFVLGRTTASDALAWASANATHCELKAQGRRLRCDDVSETALGGGQLAVDKLELRFDGRARLTSVKTTRSGLGADLAREQFGAGLALDPYERTERQQRTGNLRVSITATDFAARGIRLVERYQLG